MYLCDWRVCALKPGVVFFVLFACFSIAAVCNAQQLDWSISFGQSDVSETGFDIATDSDGGVYVFGSDRGGPQSDPAGFIVKHNREGHFSWLVRDTAIQDFAYGGTVDDQGNVYLAGGTSIASPPNATVSQYDSMGTRNWVRQFGTTSADWADQVKVDQQGAYFAAGQTLGNMGGTNAGSFDVFVRKTAGNGSSIWTAQIGTDGMDTAGNMVLDAHGNTYLTGTTVGSTDFDGIFAIKLDQNGDEVWAHRMGSGAQDAAQGIAIDQLGNTYISGFTTGDLGNSNLGDEDFFFSKIDSAGELVWTKQLGTSGSDYAGDILIDELGNIHVTGSMDGDAFLTRYDSNGNEIWTSIIDHADEDLTVFGLAVGSNGSYYLGGYGISGSGDQNVFLARVHVVPEPGGLVISFLAAATLLRRNRKRS